MQYYERVLMRVNGALAAHFGRSLPEEVKQKSLGFVYSMKYEYQLRFDEMEVVGKEYRGKVEVIMTPTGFVKKVRMAPEAAALPDDQKEMLVLSAVGKGKKKGKKLMNEAEMQVYGHFLRDIRPWVLGIRDNPEFFTLPEDAVETQAGIIAPSWLKPEHIHRTIPFSEWKTPGSVQKQTEEKEQQWLSTAEGRMWSKTVDGRGYVDSLPENLPKGAPGRVYKEDHNNRNIAYTTQRKDSLYEFEKQKSLYDAWFGHPITNSPKAVAFDEALMGILDEDFALRAAKMDWTVTRADDRAQAKRDAQDRGLEPHYQNGTGFNLSKHWNVTRREAGPLEMYDYDVMRFSSNREGAFVDRPTQHTKKRMGGWGRGGEIHSKTEIEAWNFAQDPERAPTHQKGGLEGSFVQKESWQSKLSKHPEAKAGFA
eukprot:TRINITY_DN10186_c0_g1_i1.p1 TRINITY_DN10186_c0_g1~~TRINITY_DN10186_c0_g1_i1.p1  ORF type:complete len:424 (+),score=77.66 TRINITY_DN10186_c0_g1_i1:74-1345(+)